MDTDNSVVTTQGRGLEISGGRYGTINGDGSRHDLV